MQKTDFKKTLKSLYVPGAKEFQIVEVPEMQFIKVDGAGPPGNHAYNIGVSWLYSLSYGLKFQSKKAHEKDYVVPPLEGLWWAEDYSAYRDNRRDEWLWTMMIMQPDWIDPAMYAASFDKAAAKLGNAPDSLRFESFAEGLAVQILHIGPYSDEAPLIARMHNEFLPQQGLAMNGHHHEIYLSDPRKTAPEKLKTVLRQPVLRN